MGRASVGVSWKLSCRGSTVSSTTRWQQYSQQVALICALAMCAKMTAGVPPVAQAGAVHSVDSRQQEARQVQLHSRRSSSSSLAHLKWPCRPLKVACIPLVAVPHIKHQGLPPDALSLC